LRWGRKWLTTKVRSSRAKLVDWRRAQNTARFGAVRQTIRGLPGQRVWPGRVVEAVVRAALAPLADGLDGLIANDKFCLSRFGHLRLSWPRFPLRVPQAEPDVCPSPENMLAAGGNDAGMAGSSGAAAPTGWATMLGPGLPAAPDLDAGAERERRSNRHARPSPAGGQK
jgi:hypothetical protein